MSDIIAADQLRLLIERIERLEEEKKALSDDIKDVYLEAKGTGFDTKTIKSVIKLRKMTLESRREADALLDTYKAALGMLDGTPLGHWALERLKPKKPAPEAPSVEEGDAPQIDPAEEVAAEPAPPEVTVNEARAAGQIAARAGKPVTANPFPAFDSRRAAWDEAWCAELGSDGMDIPDALRPTPKPKKGDGE